MPADSPRSLLRRLMKGFMLVMLAIWLGALAHLAWQVTVQQQRQMEIVNKAWARQIMLSVRQAVHDPAAMARIGAGIEELRADMYREVGFENNARVLIRHQGRLIYDSMPGTISPQSWVRWAERDPLAGIIVERHERPSTEWLFTLSAATSLMTPLAYSLPFLLLPTWLIVRLGLRPLRAFAADLEQRDAADLTPLPASPYRELAPLVDATNRLMARLSERLAREKEFLTDAAHELKTPLSVVQLNAHLLEHAGDGAQRGSAAAGLREGVARATHTVHQLLALERAHGNGVPAPLDLAVLVRDRIAQAAPLGWPRGVEIGFEGADGCVLPLHRESAAALLDNIIGNALKYSPDGAAVLVKLDGARLAVSDQGPGIAPELRAKVFERFYRVPGQEQSGSGLGLSIAERAAARNGAHIRLDDGLGGRGLTVTVEFNPPRRSREGGNPSSLHATSV
jgi:two-component system sensor histidine kinase QseC